ncbi:MAG: DUF1330 domain-containing protein [Caulobacterales bacterium]
MPAYMIITAKVHDRAAFLERYGKPAAALVAAHGGRYIVRAPGAEVWEGGGESGRSVVVSEWPDKAAIERFWTCAEYAALKAERGPLADVDVMVVEAL